VSVLNWIWPCRISTHLTFQVSQGSAATDLRWGKHFNKFLFRNSLLYIAVKNYENRSIFVWVIEKIKVSRFLWPTVYLWLIGSCICAFDWHQDRWPSMTLNSISLNFQRISQTLDATTAKRMKRDQSCQRQRCKHVELEQFWHAFASCSLSATAGLSCWNMVYYCN